MANQEDCKKRRRTRRQKYHNFKTVFLCSVSITILAAACAVREEEDSEYLKAVDQTERKGIGKYHYNLQRMRGYASHAMNTSPKQLLDS